MPASPVCHICPWTGGGPPLASLPLPAGAYPPAHMSGAGWPAPCGSPVNRPSQAPHIDARLRARVVEELTQEHNDRMHKERAQAEKAHNTQLLSLIAQHFSEWKEWRAQGGDKDCSAPRKLSRRKTRTLPRRSSTCNAVLRNSRPRSTASKQHRPDQQACLDTARAKAPQMMAYSGPFRI